MSQDSREKFGVKSQISIGGAVVGVGRERERERERERKKREKGYVESRTK